MGFVMQEKKLFGTIFSALVVSLMIFITIGTSTLTVASAQQQANTTGTAEHTKVRQAVPRLETLLQFF